MMYSGKRDKKAKIKRKIIAGCMAALVGMAVLCAIVRLAGALSAKASFTIVAASTTVGTPIAITGTFRLSIVSASLWFPTPDPG